MPLFSSSKNKDTIGRLDKQMRDMLDKLDPVLTTQNSPRNKNQSTYIKEGRNHRPIDLVVYDDRSKQLTVNKGNVIAVLGNESDEEPTRSLYSSENINEALEVSLTLSDVELFSQKYQFCHELKKFLKDNDGVTPEKLSDKLKELTSDSKYPRALEGHFSNTKSIVKQLQKEVASKHVSVDAQKTPNSR